MSATGGRGPLGRALAALGGGAFLRESASYAASTAAEQGSRLVTGLVVAGMLGPERWGYWFLLNLVLSYGALLHLGTLNGMNREVPAALGREEPERAVRLERVTLGALLASVCGAALLLAALSAWPAVREALPPRDGFLMLGLLAAHQLYAFVTMRGRSRMRFGLVSRQQAFFAVLHPLFAVGGAWAWGLSGFIVGQALAYLVTVATTSRGGWGLPRPELSVQEWRALVGVGLPIMLVGVVHTFFTTVDRWIVVRFLGVEALGHYSLAVMTVSAVRLLPQVFGQQTYPRMAFAWSSRRDAAELRRLGARQSSLTFASAALVSVPAAVLAPVVVHAWLPEYAPGLGALLVALSVPFATGVGRGYGNVLNVIGRQSVYLTSILGATAVNAVASLALVGPLGLTGVSLGTALGFLALSLGLLGFGGRALARAAEEAPAAARTTAG